MSDNKQQLPDKLEDYILLLRINPAAISSSFVDELNEKWKPLIQSWVMKKQFVHSCIFRQPGGVMNHANPSPHYGYYLEQSLALTGAMFIRAKDMEEAMVMAASCPTLLYGGSVEVRKTESV